jgi:hypothetical protein
VPWREMFGEEGRGLAKYGRSMSVAFVEVEGPQHYHSKDLVLAETMGGFAEGVVCVMSVVLHISIGGKRGDLPIMVVE